MLYSLLGLKVHENVSFLFVGRFFSFLDLIGMGRRINKRINSFSSPHLYDKKKKERDEREMKRKNVFLSFSFSFSCFVSFLFRVVFLVHTRHQKTEIESMFFFLSFFLSSFIQSLEEDLEGWSHGRLQVDNLDVLPVLLQERSKEVSSQLSVKSNLVSLHTQVSDSHVHGDDLLELELDGRSDLRDLGQQVVSVSDDGGELTGLGQGRS